MSAGGIRGVPRSGEASRASVRAALKDGSRAVSAAGGAGPGVTDVEVEAVAIHVTFRTYERACRDMREPIKLAPDAVWRGMPEQYRARHRAEARVILNAAAQARAAAPGPDHGEAERLRERAEALSDVLAGLSSFLGAGLPDDPEAVTPDNFDKRIRWGIDALTAPLVRMLDEARKRADAAVMALGERDHELDEAESDLAASHHAERDALAMILFVGLCGGDDKTEWMAHVAEVNAHALRMQNRAERAKHERDEAREASRRLHRRCQDDEASIAALRRMLRRFEWTGMVPDSPGRSVVACPICLGKVTVGHAPDCALAAQLGGPALEGQSQPLETPVESAAHPAAAGRAAVRTGWAITSPQNGHIIVSSIRSTRWAALLCWWRDYKLSGRGFRAAGYGCVPVEIRALTEQERQP